MMMKQYPTNTGRLSDVPWTPVTSRGRPMDVLCIMISRQDDDDAIPNKHKTSIGRPMDVTDVQGTSNGRLVFAGYTLILQAEKI